ncbi:MAG: Crp/Fnr family transcriptional regulator [Flavobacteriales bacterium]|nr:Crp/Fnr family transcriptional regulator [Flavobacteriia bacterium]NCP52849.1 Crp/Fnr family transcriptional regulator [Flavobacteriales bacterium]NCP59285.1 Crp/Fnr family transcriptional regulator [Flavobacteriales bacterium]NCQ58169.1 Crp/Fnr family transcriptional regulator [Flavobacteriales bacterium]
MITSQMRNDKILREKFIKFYSNIFEEELIEQILEIGNFEKIKAGELLVDVGDDLTHIPLIFEGTVKVIRQQKEGVELALYYLKPGDTCAISFINCIESKKSVFEALIESDMEAVFIPVENIDTWLIKYKSWRRYIIDSYHFRLMEMLDSIDGLAFNNMHGRLKKYLDDKANRSHKKVIHITHQEIANDMNTSRVVITRIMKQLQDEGKVIISRNKIKVLSILT